MEGPDCSKKKNLSPSLQDEDDPIVKIPNEVWVLILSQLNQKELVQARTVWKKWREVVDAHFEFTVIVHDGKTDLDRVYQLRIKDCLITRLLRDTEIFQYPNLIRRVRFWGPVAVTCFQGIMDKTVSVEELSLTKFALMQEGLIGERKLCGFSKIKKLELLGYMCKDESRSVANNVSNIFSYTMPDLEKLTVNFHCDISSINQIVLSFMEFISRHNRLQNLQVSLVPEASHPTEQIGNGATVNVPKAVNDLMGDVQLNMLRITTATKDLHIWAALLNSQTHLHDLRMHLSEGGLLTLQGTNYVVGIPFDMVKEPLLRNASTLSSIELKELRLTPVNGDAVPLDASVFRYSFNLKRLILYRNIDDYRRFSQYPEQPNIINLRMLPTSIELLEITRFYCKSEELQFVVDVLENLKNIVLAHTGNISRLGVHGGIVESIASKSEIQTMNLTPLNYHSSLENKKYDSVKAKFGMTDGDHLYYDFERFRKGLPQPRPPTETSSIQHRIHNYGATSSRRCRARRRTPCPYGYRDWEGWPYVGITHGFITRPRQPRQCLCEPAPPAGSHVEGSCPREPLSRLFFSLDLHIAQGQRTIASQYLTPRLPSHARPRRWSTSNAKEEFSLPPSCRMESVYEELWSPR